MTRESLRARAERLGDEWSATHALIQELVERRRRIEANLRNVCIDMRRMEANELDKAA